MRRFGEIILACFLFGLLPQGVHGAAAGKPDFHELYSVIGSNLPAGMTREELNAIAARSLLSALEPRVTLLGKDARAGATNGEGMGGNSVTISKSAIFEGSIGYMRVQEVKAGLAETLAESYRQLATTNKIQGLVLDLRYTGGGSYEQAAAVTDHFVATEKPLLDWGAGMVSTKDRVALVNVPAAVLVNGETAGAAEALAGALRESGAALVLGGRTAGTAGSSRDFELSGGQKLRINVQPILLGNGKELPLRGVQPDIAVSVNAEEERVYFADAFAVVTRTNGLDGASGLIVGQAGTNRVTRRLRFNEADLVREHSEGGRTNNIRRLSTEPEQQIVNDPVLARALDVLKGLAVVRQRR